MAQWYVAYKEMCSNVCTVQVYRVSALVGNEFQQKSAKNSWCEQMVENTHQTGI